MQTGAWYVRVEMGVSVNPMNYLHLIMLFQDVFGVINPFAVKSRHTTVDSKLLGL